MTKIELLESIGALEEGVIIPTCNIREQLSKMECGEARKAKRKWRKLMRKAKKQIPEGQNISKNAQIYYVRKKLRKIGKKKLG